MKLDKAVFIRSGRRQRTTNIFWNGVLSKLALRSTKHVRGFLGARPTIILQHRRQGESASRLCRVGALTKNNACNETKLSKRSTLPARLRACRTTIASFSNSVRGGSNYDVTKPMKGMD